MMKRFLAAFLSLALGLGVTVAAYAAGFGGLLNPFAVSSAFTPFSTEYTTPGTQTVSIPAGATTFDVECIAAGGGGTSGAGLSGGSGGGYAKKSGYSVAGLTGVFISVPNTTAVNSDGASCFSKENSSGGTDIIRATGGAGSVGDTLRTGGSATAAGASGGGGAAGTTGNGSNNSGSSGGAGGGTPAGAGGNGNAAGNNYGGGGGDCGASGTNCLGAQGWLKISWN